MLRAEVERVAARHVIWATVPHVTVAPIARGVGGKVAPGSRYFPYYTRPWVADADFDPDEDPHITAAEARAVDYAIDLYNEAITDTVARRPRRRARLVPVRHRGRARPAGQPALHRRPERAPAVVDAVPAPAGAGRAAPGARTRAS